MNKMDELPIENTPQSTKDFTSESNVFGVYSYFKSIILYDKTGIYNLTGEWTPSSKTLLEEWDKLNNDELEPSIQEKISKIHETITWKRYTRDEIFPMLFPDTLDKSFISLVNESKEFTEFEKEKINIALSIMKDAHKNQFRDEWLPYYIHPLKVAFNILTNWWTYEEVVCWLLHDIIEDNENIDIDTLYKEFGESIVDGLFALSKKIWNWEKKEEAVYIKNISNNQIATKVKWYDRINNISSTYFSTQEKRDSYIKETETVYIPFFEEHNPKVAQKLKEIIKYIKLNEKPSEKELQLIKQVHDTYVLTEKIQESE